jgi:hypothetical protein
MLKPIRTKVSQAKRQKNTHTYVHKHTSKFAQVSSLDLFAGFSIKQSMAKYIEAASSTTDVRWTVGIVLRMFPRVCMCVDVSVCDYLLVYCVLASFCDVSSEDEHAAGVIELS